MNHALPLLRLVFVGIDGSARTISNLDRQLEQNFNIAIHNVQS